MVFSALVGSVPVCPSAPFTSSTNQTWPWSRVFAPPRGMEIPAPTIGMPKEVTPFGKLVNGIASLLLLQKRQCCRRKNRALRPLRGKVTNRIFSAFQHPVTCKPILNRPCYVHLSRHLVKRDGQNECAAWYRRFVSVAVHQELSFSTFASTLLTNRSLT